MNHTAQSLGEAIKPRPYQTESINALRSNVARGIKAQVLQLATGGGKTQIASEVAKSAVAKGNRVFFIVDSIELVDQTLRRFEADGMSCGVIQGQHFLTDYSKQVQVGTIQTLRSRWEYMPESIKPGVLIIDECHVMHRAHELIINECKSKGIPVIGLSATPFRKGMGKVFDELVVGATTASLTEQGFLVPAVCYAPFVPDLKGIKTASNGDWMSDALAELMGDAKVVGDVVENWLKLAEGRQTIVFSANVAHSRFLCDAFQARGIRAAHIDGYERDPEVREQVINDFRAGRITVLTNCMILTKGFDAPETSCVILARPTKSLMLHIQTIGRGLRIAPGKTNCIVIDHSGNILRNGLPTDRLPEELDDGKGDRNLDRKKREEREPVAKSCSSCGFVSTAHKCPSCGFEPKAREDVEVIDGELYEVTSAQSKKFSTDELEGFYSELLGYARHRGFNAGWAWHKCREYAGRAPRATRTIPACQPSDKTLSIIKHLQIKGAKRRVA